MTGAGLDVGSRTIKLVTFADSVRDSVVLETGANPLRRSQELMSGKNYEHLVVTGYGRHLVAPALHGEIVSEIRAFAVGAKYLYPDCRTIIDIGGQDSKVISLSVEGDVQKFEMNDRCSAGTGKFIEIMANTLEVGIGDMSKLALSAHKTVHINSLCTVFAESEVVSLIGRGEETGAIALAIHETIATRIAAMARRIGVREKVIFAGGAALNSCLRQLVGNKLGTELAVPEIPQTVGALGAALLASGYYSHLNKLKHNGGQTNG
ncbi:MAG: acyl-CoA dehydratase activase [Chloroflexota bacterium]